MRGVAVRPLANAAQQGTAALARRLQREVAWLRRELALRGGAPVKPYGVMGGGTLEGTGGTHGRAGSGGVAAGNLWSVAGGQGEGAGAAAAGVDGQAGALTAPLPPSNCTPSTFVHVLFILRGICPAKTHSIQDRQTRMHRFAPPGSGTLAAAGAAAGAREQLLAFFACEETAAPEREALAAPELGSAQNMRQLLLAARARLCQPSCCGLMACDTRTQRSWCRLCEA